MVYRTQHYVEGAGVIVSGREDSVSRQVRLSGMLLSIQSTGPFSYGAYSETSTHCRLQDVCVFQTQAFGKVLVLDGKHDASAMYKAALPSQLHT